MKHVAKFRYVKGDADSGQIFVNGSVDNVVQDFFLDTGSPHTFVHAIDHIKNKTITKSKSYFSASGQAKKFDYIDVQNLSIGPITSYDASVALIHDLESEPPKLGLNIFKPHKVEFDFINHQLSEIASSLDLKKSFELGPKGHIQFVANFGNQKLVCIFDTGAGLSVIDSKFVEKFPEFFKLSDSEATVGDANDINTATAIYNVSTFSIGDVDFSNSSVVALDMDDFKSILGVEHMMILGFNHIVGKKWAFDFESCRYELSK